MGGVFHNKKISQASRFNGGSRDGVAIFYNTDKLECIFSDKFVLPDDKGKDSTQIGLYVVLRDTKTREIFSYVAAHCKSGKKPKDFPTKDAQPAFIATLVTRLALSGLKPALGLDFNSNYKEQVIETFKKGVRNVQDGTPIMVSAYQQTEELKAAYKIYDNLSAKNAHEPDQNKNAPMTAWKNRLFGEQLEKAGKQFKEELDYIFYEQRAWQVTQVLKVPHRDAIEECKMPGWKYPSDHFMIMAVLALKKAKALPSTTDEKSCDPTEEEKAQEASPSPSTTPTMASLEKRYAAEDEVAEENMKRRAAETEARQAREASASIHGKEGRRRLSSAEELLHRRRLADTARMEAKDVAAISPSELIMHRRRLAHGVRVSPVLAALMEHIEEAQLNNA